MITTVVRSFNRLVLDASISVADRVLSFDAEQWDAVRGVADRHPFRSWNPLIFLDKAMIAELERDLRNAKYEAAVAREAEAMDEAYPPLSEPVEVPDLEELRARFREALEQNALNTKRARSLSTVTSMPFCTDGIGDTA